MNYPGGVIPQQTTKPITYSNRGMDLEYEINLSNTYYQEENIAFIYKKPTPIKISKVDFSVKKKAIIKEAFFESPSTTDYNGLYRGCYIDFEAKETLLKTSFPLSNIHPHQIDHMRHIQKHGGICFLIVRFKSLNETYLLPAKDFISYIDTEKQKSIRYDYFKSKGHLLVDKIRPRIDYLTVVDQIYGGMLHG